MPTLRPRTKKLLRRQPVKLKRGPREPRPSAFGVSRVGRAQVPRIATSAESLCVGRGQIVRVLTALRRAAVKVGRQTAAPTPPGLTVRHAVRLPAIARRVLSVRRVSDPPSIGPGMRTVPTVRHAQAATGRTGSLPEKAKVPAARPVRPSVAAIVHRALVDSAVTTVVPRRVTVRSAHVLRVVTVRSARVLRVVTVRSVHVLKVATVRSVHVLKVATVRSVLVLRVATVLSVHVLKVAIVRSVHVLKVAIVRSVHVLRVAIVRSVHVLRVATVRSVLVLRVVIVRSVHALRVATVRSVLVLRVVIVRSVLVPRVARPVRADSAVDLVDRRLPALVAIVRSHLVAVRRVKVGRVNAALADRVLVRDVLPVAVHLVVTVRRAVSVRRKARVQVPAAVGAASVAVPASPAASLQGAAIALRVLPARIARHVSLVRRMKHEFRPFRPYAACCCN